jgi:membrane-bound ClpP family serine protease
VSPTAAFLVFICGLLAIYCELMWPGRIAPGVLGAAATVTGAYFLLRPPFEPAGLALALAGAVLLACEAAAGPAYLFGALGTVALSAGFAVLLPPPRAIAAAAAIPASVAFGAVSTLLAASAKRARRNKRPDLPE